MDYRNKGHHERKPHSGGTSLRHRSAMPSPMVSVMVFSTNKPQQQVREQWNKSGQIQDTVSSAIEVTCNIAFDGAHTPRECFLRAVTILLSYAPDKNWKLEEEMQGWSVEEDRIARLSAVRGSVGRAMNSEQSH